MLDVSYDCCLWPAVRLLAFYNFFVVRLLAFSPLVCGLGTLFVLKKLKWLPFFADFGPLEAHFGINFGTQEPFGRHFEYEQKKGRPKGAPCICTMVLLGPRGGVLGSILGVFLV